MPEKPIHIHLIFPESITIHKHEYDHRSKNGEEKIIELVGLVLNKLTKMNENLTKLQTDVSEATTVMSSATAFIKGVGKQLKDAIAQLAAQGVDNAILNDLSTALDTEKDALAQAIVENTVAAEEPPAEEPPAEEPPTEEPPQ